MSDVRLKILPPWTIVMRKFEAAASLKRENKHSTETCITNVCRGKKKTAYGFKWQYVE